MIILYFVKLVCIFRPRQLQKEQFLENTAKKTTIETENHNNRTNHYYRRRRPRQGPPPTLLVHIY